MPELERTIASNRQRQRTHGLQANRAFVVESLLLLLFLAFALALILRMFAAADMTAREAHAKNMAVHLASNTAEVFAARPLEAPSETFYDSEGNAVDQGSDQAVFKVTLGVDKHTTDAGTFYDATITVDPLSRKAGIESYELKTARYVSDARLAALAAYAASQANENNAAADTSSEEPEGGA